MAELVQIIDIAEPMQDRQSAAGKTYRAMKVTVKLSDGSLKTLLSFDEKKVGEQVSVEQNDAGYWNVVKPARGYDKPAPSNQTDVMQALRMEYVLLSQIDKKLDALLADIGITAEKPDISSAVNAAILDAPIPEPTSGLDKFKQARAEKGLVSRDTLPTDEDMEQQIDLSEIPF